MHHGRETGGTRSQARPCCRRGAEKFMLRWLLIELLLPALTVMGRTKRFLLTTTTATTPPVGRSTQPPASRSRIFLGVCNQKVSCCCAVIKSPAPLPHSPNYHVTFLFPLSFIVNGYYYFYPILPIRHACRGQREHIVAIQPKVPKSLNIWVGDNDGAQLSGVSEGNEKGAMFYLFFPRRRY